MSANNESLYHVLSIRSTDVLYPCCINCFKKVFYLSHRKKWHCTSCNEEFIQTNHRYKLSLEITNFHDFKSVAVFGKIAETIFGIESNNFYRYKNKLIEKGDNWSYSIDNAFRNCILGRWFLLDIKEVKSPNKPKSFLINSVKVPQNEIENFIPIYYYLKNRSKLINEFSLSDSLCFENSNSSIIDETLSEETDYGESVLSTLVENMTLLR